MEELSHFIDGKRVSGTSGRFADVFNPATGAPIGTMHHATSAQATQAITDATPWDAPVATRADILNAVARVQDAHGLAPVDSTGALLSLALTRVGALDRRAPGVALCAATGRACMPGDGCTAGRAAD